MRLDWNKFFLLLVAAFIVGILSILHVIIGYAKTPHGLVYMWTGHYYLDYFYYLQFIAQGLRGYWLPHQYSATDDPSIYFHLQPYILLGEIGRLFRLSPIAAYWIAVFILAMILALLIFFVIREVLKDKPFYVQFGAFMITLFAGPFYKIVFGTSGLNINSFDYWASYGTFFKRFEPVPHHLLAHILTIVTLLFIARYLDDKKKTILKTFFSAFFIGGLMLAELSFFPFQVILIFSAVAITSLLYFFLNLIKRQRRQAAYSLIFLSVIGVGLLLGGIVIRNIYEQTSLFSKIKAMEEVWRKKVSIETVILNLGPSFLLGFFGLKEFARRISTMKILMITFVVSSLIFFYSSLDQVLQTHNGRFLSPISYILFGSLGVLGVLSISSFVGRFNNLVFALLIFLVILFSLLPNAQSFMTILNDKNLDSPITRLPKEIIDGFKFLSKQPGKENTLITPSQFLGSVLPIYVDRRSYVVRHPETPNYLEKNIRASNFYLGAMTNEEALNFLLKNGLKFVVLTSIEGYDVAPLYRYPFLKEIYKNKDIVIFEVTNERNYSGFLIQMSF